MNNGYLIPANSKRGTLILNVFNYTDLILFGSGIGTTIFLLLLIPTSNLLITLVVLAPAVVSGVLVTPIPNYHNVLTVLKAVIRFYRSRQNFIWKGWCINEQYNEKK
jgi:hypothetical protein